MLVYGLRLQKSLFPSPLNRPLPYPLFSARFFLSEEAFFYVFRLKFFFFISKSSSCPLLKHYVLKIHFVCIFFYLLQIFSSVSSVSSPDVILCMKSLFQAPLGFKSPAVSTISSCLSRSGLTASESSTNLSFRD